MADSNKEVAHASGNGRRVLGPQDVKRSPEIKEVELPGREGVFRLQKIAWREKEEIDLAALITTTDREGNITVRREGRMYMPRIVAAAWVDERGERYYKTLAEAEQLADADIELISKLYEAVADFNGFGEVARAEMGKDSSGTPTASGGSPSVSRS
jgi:hypothetical protein